VEVSEFTIRPCGPSEAPQLSELAARLFEEAYGPTHPEPTLSVYLAESFAPERLRAELTSPGARVLLVEDAAGLPIGYAYLRETEQPATAGVPGERPVEIVRFYVDSAWHGRGVAQALMTGCVAEAARRGADVLWLSAWQQAARALAFYRRAGFAVVGTATFRFGERIDDDFLMARRLTPADGGDESRGATP
jgi:ribosomal protein S18 acetylase RimI-like enzyme